LDSFTIRISGKTNTIGTAQFFLPPVTQKYARPTLPFGTLSVVLLPHGFIRLKAFQIVNGQRFHSVIRKKIRRLFLAFKVQKETGFEL
jgi:hypothetical protein